MPTIAILGGGIWGGAFAKALLSPLPASSTESDTTHSNLQLCFWDRDASAAQALARDTGGECSENIAGLLSDADIIIVAVSSAGFLSVLQEIAGADIPTKPPVLWLTKGFASGELLLCEAAESVLPNRHFGALSGPTFANEIAAGLPAAMVLSTNRGTEQRDLQNILHRKMLRLYASDDLPGVCLAGALKNVIAIAAGICDGLSLGANARAALITRGLAEMNLMNQAVGGRIDTMAGIAGIGDLLLTCTSDLSRNRRLGLAIGRGQPPAAETTEGVAAAAAARRRAAKLNLSLPIIAAVDEVLQGNLQPAAAVEQLLSRPPPAG